MEGSKSLKSEKKKKKVGIKKLKAKKEKKESGSKVKDKKREKRESKKFKGRKKNVEVKRIRKMRKEAEPKENKTCINQIKTNHQQLLTSRNTTHLSPWVCLRDKSR